MGVPPPVAPAGIEGRAGCDTEGPTRAGRRLELGLDRVEVAYGEAEVLPLLAEDHVQARTGGLLAPGIVRVLARRGQHLRCDCREEVAHHRDATALT